MSIRPVLQVIEARTGGRGCHSWLLQQMLLHFTASLFAYHGTHRRIYKYHLHLCRCGTYCDVECVQDKYLASYRSWLAEPETRGWPHVGMSVPLGRVWICAVLKRLMGGLYFWESSVAVSKKWLALPMVSVSRRYVIGTRHRCSLALGSRQQRRGQRPLVVGKTVNLSGWCRPI